MSSNKRIVKNTLMLYFRMILIMGVTLYTSRVVLDILGVEDFGIYNVVGGIVVMFGFLNSAMSSATQRFLSFELGRKDFVQLKKVFSLSVSIHVLIAVAIFILAETIGFWFLNTKLTIPPVRMEAANWVYQFSIFAFMVNVMAVPYNAAIISRERMNVYAYVSILEVVLQLMIVFILQWFGFDKLKLYAVLVFAVSFIVRMIYQIYCRREFEECRWQFVWDKEKFREMFGFAGWSLFGNLSVVLRSQGSNILLNIFFGPTINASRGIAYQLDAALEKFVSNFQTALNPSIVKSYANKEIERVMDLSFQGGRFSFYLLFLLSLPLLFQTNDVLLFWLPTVPEYSVEFTQLIIINGLINSFTKPFIAVAQATGKIQLFQGINGGLSLLTLPVMYWIIYLGYSPISTLLVLIVFSLITSVLRYIVIKLAIPVFSTSMYLKNVVLRILIVTIVTSVLCYIVSYKFCNNDTMVAFFMRTISIVFISFVCIYFLGLSLIERKFIKKKIIGKLENIIGDKYHN